MKQKLSPMAFLELFTDDDMDVITMRKLLRNTAARREEVYREQGQVLEAAAKQVCCPYAQTSRYPKRALVAHLRVHATNKSLTLNPIGLEWHQSVVCSI
jgi:hypothetical protein